MKTQTTKHLEAGALAAGNDYRIKEITDAAGTRYTLEARTTAAPAAGQWTHIATRKTPEALNRIVDAANAAYYRTQEARREARRKQSDRELIEAAAAYLDAHEHAAALEAQARKIRYQAQQTWNEDTANACKGPAGEPWTYSIPYHIAAKSPRGTSYLIEIDADGDGQPHSITAILSA